MYFVQVLWLKRFANLQVDHLHSFVLFFNLYGSGLHQQDNLATVSGLNWLLTGLRCSDKIFNDEIFLRRPDINLTEYFGDILETLCKFVIQHQRSLTDLWKFYRIFYMIYHQNTSADMLIVCFNVWQLLSKQDESLVIGYL